jgi:hypothetical protein
MKNSFRTVIESELEDFATECHAHSLDPNEFELNEHDYIETPVNNIIFSPNAKLTVTRNNISRTYLTGNATHWIADFSTDLKNGVFN